MSDIWDQARLQRYIDDKVEEDAYLDYKAGGALAKNPQKREEVTKDVSAMANAGGGMIIYGLAEGRTKATKHLATRFEAVDRTVISKETLEHFIGNIRPRIDGIIIHSVQLDTGPDEVAYVVEIPQSNTAHQAMSKLYYKRFNFEAVPMEDYEIRDVMGRGKYPKIELSFQVNKTVFKTRPTTTSNDPLAAIRESLTVQTTDIYGHRAKDIGYKLEISAENTGLVYSQFVSIFVHVPYVLTDWQLPSSVLWKHIYTEDDIEYYEFRPSASSPILPNLTQTWDFDLTDTWEQMTLDGLRIKWEVYADNAPPTTGEMMASEIDIVEHRLFDE